MNPDSEYKFENMTVDSGIDLAWKDEIIARSNAYKEGRLETVSLKQALCHLNYKTENQTTG